MPLSARAVAAAAALLLGVACAPQATYHNPVFTPILADPSVVQADGSYYVYGTQDDWGDGQGDRLVPILRSQDLVAWEYVGEAFTERPDWKDDGGIWAPHGARVGDAYHLYYSLSLWGDADPGIGVATAERPEGPFTDRGKLFTSSEIGVGNSIDPFLFSAERHYLFWGSFQGIYGVALSADGLAVDGEPFQIAGTAFEAPWIMQREGAYWLFVSTGSCCEGADSTYALSVGRADALEGPYLDREGRDLLIAFGESLLTGDDAYAGPGHNALVTDAEGADWLLYHAIDTEQPYAPSGANRRVLMLDRLDWSSGWPTVTDGSPSTDELPAPDLW